MKPFKILVLAVICFIISAFCVVGIFVSIGHGAERIARIEEPARNNQLTPAVATSVMEQAFAASPPEPFPASDLWVYESGSIGTRVRILDVFVHAKNQHGWASFRGDEPPLMGEDDKRWRECAWEATKADPGVWIVCTADRRLWREVHGPDDAP